MMKKATLVMVLALAATAAYAQKAPTVEQKLEKLSTLYSDLKPSRTVLLYPDGQGGSGKKTAKLAKTDKGYAAMLGPGESNGITCSELARKGGFIAFVSDSARVDLYFPEKPNGQMVLSTPGGSYKDLSTWNEGKYVAQWMLKRGITVGVVKYRLPNGHWTVPLTDVQNAFRYCRAHSQEWGVDQIGVIGFSAGGHLAATVETMYTDSLTKPDFAILIYPVATTDDAITHKNTKGNLIGYPEKWLDRDGYSFAEYYERRRQYEELVERYSTDKNVTSCTPKTFIALSTDDKLVPAANSLRFYQALVDSKVPAELHVYPYGAHGWGFTDPELLGIPASKDILGAARADFSASLERWLGEVRIGDIAKDVEKTDKDVEPKPVQTVHLYPLGQNAATGLPEAQGPCESNGCKGPELITDNMHYRNVGDSARFELFLADEKIATGQMVVICPGGGYWISAQRNEGTFAAKWMLDRGISVALVKYRMPMGHWRVPLTDVQNTFRWCRAHADELGIKKIGVMGFSAGGHLAASASVLYTDAATRPDFSILFYPVITMEHGVTHEGTRNNLLGGDAKWGGRVDEHKQLVEHYSLENQVTADTPRTILILCSDDATVPAANSVRYFTRLVESNVAAEMHCFPAGGHGWGFRTAAIGTDKVFNIRPDIDRALTRFLNESK